MDPWNRINPQTDSTYVIALEAQKRGYRLFSYTVENLFLENGIVYVVGNEFSLHPEKSKFFTLKKEKKLKI